MSRSALGQTTAGRDHRFAATVFDDEADLQATVAVYLAPVSAEVLGSVVRGFPWEDSVFHEGDLSESYVIETLASLIATTSDRDEDDDVRAFAALLAREPLVPISRSPMSVESILDLIDKSRKQGTYEVALVIGALAYHVDDPLWILWFAGAIVVVAAARRAGDLIDNLDVLVRPRLAGLRDATALPRARRDAVTAVARTVGCPLGVSIRIAPNGVGQPGDLLRPHTVLDAFDSDTCERVKDAVLDLTHLIHEARAAGSGRNAVIQLYADGAHSARRLRDELLSHVAGLHVREGYG